MDTRRWKKILLHWITECGFMERNYFNIEQSDIEAFFQGFCQQMRYNETGGESASGNVHLANFLQEQYPGFEPHFDDDNSLSAGDYLYVYSLLLHFSCVKCPESYFHEICQKLSDQSQQSIATFFKQLLDVPAVTKETLRHAIADVIQLSPRGNESFVSGCGGLPSPSFARAESPIKTPKRATTQRLSPSTPKTFLLEERTRELYNLRAQLETERYEKGLLEVQIKQNEEKILKLNGDHRKLQQQIQDLKNDILTRNTENNTSPKRVTDEQIKRGLVKEISQKEKEISKLTDILSTLREEKSLVQEKLNYAEKQIVVCMDRIKELDYRVDELSAELEQKNGTIKYLTDNKLELEQFINETRSASGNSRPDLNISIDCLDASFSRTTNSSGSQSSPENLGCSVIDVQLREKEHENIQLREQLLRVRTGNTKLAKQIQRLSQMHADEWQLSIECIHVNDNEMVDPAEHFAIYANCVQRLSKLYKTEQNTVQQLKQEAQRQTQNSAELNARVQQFELDVQEMKNCLRSIEQSNEQLEETKQQLLKAVATANEETQAAKEEVLALKKDATANEETAQKLRVQLDELQLQLTQQNEQSELEQQQLQQKIDALNEKLKYKSEAFELEVKSLNERLAISKHDLKTHASAELLVKDKYEKLLIQSEDLKRNTRDADEHLEAMRNELAVKDMQMQKLGNEILDVCAKNEALEQRVDTLLTEHRQHKQTSDMALNCKQVELEQLQQQLQHELEEVQQQLSESREQQQQTQQSYKNGKQQLQEVSIRVENLQELLNEMEFVDLEEEEEEFKEHEIKDKKKDLKEKTNVEQQKLKEEKLAEEEYTKEQQYESEQYETKSIIINLAACHAQVQQLLLYKNRAAKRLELLASDNALVNTQLKQLERELRDVLADKKELLTRHADAINETRNELAFAEDKIKEYEGMLDVLRREQQAFIENLEQQLQTQVAEKTQQLTQQLQTSAADKERTMRSYADEWRMAKDDRTRLERELLLVIGEHNALKLAQSEKLELVAEVQKQLSAVQQQLKTKEQQLQENNKAQATLQSDYKRKIEVFEAQLEPMEQENQQLKAEIDSFKQEYVRTAERLLQANEAVEEVGRRLLQESAAKELISEQLTESVQKRQATEQQLQIATEQQLQNEQLLKQLKLKMQEQQQKLEKQQRELKEQQQKFKEQQENLQQQLDEELTQLKEQLQLAQADKQQLLHEKQQLLKEQQKLLQTNALQRQQSETLCATLQSELVAKEAEHSLQLDEFDSERVEMQSKLMRRIAEQSEQLEAHDMAWIELQAMLEPPQQQQSSPAKQLAIVQEETEEEEEAEAEQLKLALRNEQGETRSVHVKQLLTRLLKQQTRLQQQNGAAQQQLKTAEDSVMLLNKANTKLNMQLMHQQTEINDLQEMLAGEAKSIESRLANEVKRLNDDLQNLEFVNEKLTGENATLQMKAAGAEDELESVRLSLQLLNEQRNKLLEDQRFNGAIMERMQSEERKLNEQLRDKQTTREELLKKREELQTRSEELKKTRDELQMLNEKLAMQENKLDVEQNSAQEVLQKCEVLQRENAALAVKEATLHKELKALQVTAAQESKQSAQQLQQLNAQLKTANETQQLYEKQQTALQQTLQTELRDAKREWQRANDNVSELIQQIASIRLEKEALQEEQLQLRRQYEQQEREQIANADAKIKTLEAELQRVREQRDKADQQVEKLQLDAKKQREIHDASTRRIEKMALKLGELQARSSKLERDNDKLQQSSDAHNGAVEALQREKEQLNNESKQLRVRVSSAERAHEQSASKLQALEQEFEALQMAKEKLAASDAEARAKLVKYEKMRDTHDEKLRKLNQTLNQSEQTNVRLNLEIGALNSQLNERRRSQSEEQYQQLEEKQQQLEHLQQQLEQMQQQLKQSQQQYEQSQQQLQQTQQKLESAERHTEQLSDKNSKLSLTQQRSEEQCTVLAQDLQELRDEQQATQEELHTMQAQKQQLAEQLAEQKTQMEALLIKRETQKEKLAEQKEQLAEQTEKLEALQEKLEIQQSEIDAQKIILDTQQTELESQQAETAAKETELQQLQLEFTTKQAELEAQLTELLALKTELKKSQSADAAAAATVNDEATTAEMHELRKRLAVAEAVLSQEQSTAKQLRLDNQVLQAKYAEAKQRMRDEGQVNEDRIKENRLEMEGKLEKMKNKMKDLYTDEITKLKTKHDRGTAILHTDLELLKAQNIKYDEHTRKLSSQIVRLNDNILEQQKQNAILTTKLKHLEEAHDAQFKRPNSIHVSTLSSTAASSNIGTNLAMEDEEGEVFNNTYLTDLKNGRMSELMSRDICAEELHYRNSLLPPHLKSTYAAQYDHGMSEDDIRDGPHSLDDSMSALLSTTVGGTRKKVSGCTSYKRPGPPTPSKNGGRLSFGGTSEPAREILRETCDGNVAVTSSSSAKTPARFKIFSSRFSMGNVNIKDETPAKNLRKAVQRKNFQLINMTGAGAVCTSTPRKSKSYFDQRRILDKMSASSTSPSPLAATPALPNSKAPRGVNITPPDLSIIETPPCGTTAQCHRKLFKQQQQISQRSLQQQQQNSMRRRRSTIFKRRYSRKFTNDDMGSDYSLASSPHAAELARCTTATTSSGGGMMSSLQRRLRRRPKRDRGTRPSIYLRGNIFAKYRTPQRGATYRDIFVRKARKQRTDNFNKFRMMKSTMSTTITIKPATIKSEKASLLETMASPPPPLPKECFSNVTFDIQNNNYANVANYNAVPLGETMIIVKKEEQLSREASAVEASAVEASVFDASAVKTSAVEVSAFKVSANEPKLKQHLLADSVLDAQAYEDDDSMAEDYDLGDDYEEYEDEDEEQDEDQSEELPPQAKDLVTTLDLLEFDRLSKVAGIGLKHSHNEEQLPTSINEEATANSQHFEQLLAETESNAPFEVHKIDFESLEKSVGKCATEIVKTTTSSSSLSSSSTLSANHSSLMTTNTTTSSSSLVLGVAVAATASTCSSTLSLSSHSLQYQVQNSPNSSACLSRTIYGASAIHNRKLPHVNTTYVRKSSIYVKRKDHRAHATDNIISITNQTITLLDLAHMWRQMDSSARLIVSFAVLASATTIICLFITFFGKR